MPIQELLTLRLRLRPDLVVCPQQSGARRTWVVKDPIALRYFTFCSEEFSILKSLDGTQRLEELREQFERSFAPQRMSTTRLAQFLSSLYANGLLLSDDVDQGSTLLEKGAKQLREERLRTWTNVLAIRFRGIDPEAFLCWLEPKVRWCFSPLAIGGYVVLLLSAAVLMLSHLAEFRAELPSLSEFISAKNVLWLSVALAITKVLHEFAHAITCKQFGGECHEMGVILLLFTPCLYCNVTDAWMLRDRRQRIAISAAGIVAEVILASLAVFGWWYTQPGLFHTIFVNIILVCSIGTVLFNGNPLLRYDGYFVLSDLLGLPNLWQESRSLIRRRVANWFSSNTLEAVSNHEDRAVTLIVYGVASTIYQVIVVVGIVLTLYRCLTAAGMEVLAYLLMLSMVVGSSLNSLSLIRRRLASPSFMKRTRWPRVAAAATVVAAMGLLFLFAPLPCRLVAPALVQPRGAQQIYVATAGTLTFAAQKGERVQARQVIARLQNAEIRRKVAELTGEHEKLLARVKHLEARATVDAAVVAELAVAREMSNDAEQRLFQQRREQEALILTAPVDGIVIPPSLVERVGGEEAVQLPTWSGTPLDSQNANCYLPRGTLFCLVGNPAQLEAVVFVNEIDIQFIRKGQPVRLWFDVGRAVALSGKVAEIAEGDMQFVPTEFAAEKELASRMDPTGNRRPLETAYQVRLELDPEPNATAVIIGSRGLAKIEVEPQTLAERLYRLLLRTLSARI